MLNVASFPKIRCSSFGRSRVRGTAVNTMNEVQKQIEDVFYPLMFVVVLCMLLVNSNTLGDGQSGNIYIFQR